MITTDTPPFSDLTVGMELTESNSVGLNINKTATSKTLTPHISEDFLEIFCEAQVAVSGGEILYTLSGTDADNYELSEAKVTVTVDTSISVLSGYPTLIYSPLTTSLK